MSKVEWSDTHSDQITDRVMEIQKKEWDPVDWLEAQYPAMTSEFKKLQRNKNRQHPGIL